jgi:hypothetical protein
MLLTAVRWRLVIIGCAVALITGLSVANSNSAWASDSASAINGYCEAIADPVQISFGLVTGTGHSDCQGVGGVWFGDELTVVICIQKQTSGFPFYSFELLRCSEPVTEPWPVIGNEIQTPILSGYNNYRIRTHVYGTYHHEPINIYGHSSVRGYDPD